MNHYPATSRREDGLRAPPDELQRVVHPRFAPLIQALELERPSVLTLADAGRLLGRAPDGEVRRLLTDLVREGWLRRVARGSYEFIPGAAAGPYPSGDPWLPLRAELRQGRTGWHAGATSAAFLLGYAQREPVRHLVVGSSALRPSRSLRRHYVVHGTDPATASAEREGIPVPTPAELFAEIAQLAPRLVLSDARGWLARLLRDVEPEVVAVTLAERSPATRARAGFLAEQVGADQHAAALLPLAPHGSGPFFTGRASPSGSFSSRWRVYDSACFGGAA